MKRVVAVLVMVAAAVSLSGCKMLECSKKKSAPAAKVEKKAEEPKPVEKKAEEKKAEEKK
jgi:hypothetical protein